MTISMTMSSETSEKFLIDCSICWPRLDFLLFSKVVPDFLPQKSSDGDAREAQIIADLQTEFANVAAGGAHDKYYVAYFYSYYSQALVFCRPNSSEGLLVSQLSNFSTNLRTVGTLGFAAGISLFPVGAMSFGNPFQL